MSGTLRRVEAMLMEIQEVRKVALPTRVQSRFLKLLDDVRAQGPRGERMATVILCRSLGARYRLIGAALGITVATVRELERRGWARVRAVARGWHGVPGGSLS